MQLRQRGHNRQSVAFHTGFSRVFHPLYYGAAISTPAFSTPCIFNAPAFSTPAFSVAPPLAPCNKV